MLRKIAHIIFRTDMKKKQIRKFAYNIRNKKILELGSGKKEKRRYGYSVKKMFDKSNEFIQSDVVKEYGHRIVDVTKMKFRNEFDIILCLNVLEHVFDFKKGIDNIYLALKKGGKAVIILPVFYPLHDEPYDYWRFTEHSLRKLLGKFKDLKIIHSGIKQFPFAYYIEASK